MVMTPSNMLPLGTKAPEFSLPDPSGEMHGLGEGHKAYVVMFICNHCPFVKLLRDALAKFARDYDGKELRIVAINSNNAEQYPDDSPEKMAEEIENFGYIFPYVHDESQEVAKAYDAACTPDFFVFDAEKKLAYRGQFDGARPGNGVDPSGEDLRKAVDLVLAGKDVPEPHSPSVGCNIKWK